MRRTKRKLLPLQDAPLDTVEHVSVKYKGKEIFVTPEQYKMGKHRAEFIRQHGIVLPKDSTVPYNDIKKYYCPDLHLLAMAEVK